MIKLQMKFLMVVMLCIAMFILFYFIGNKTINKNSTAKNLHGSSEGSSQQKIVQGIIMPKDNYTIRKSAEIPNKIKEISNEIIPGGIKSNDISTLWEMTSKSPWTIRPSPISESNWYIGGVINRSDQTHIIIKSTDSSEQQLLRVGDSLPGKFKISWIKNNQIGIISSLNEKIKIDIF